MSLPNIQEAIAAIRTLPEALNVIEQLMSINHQLIHRIEVLEREVARLKGQPKKPTYTSSPSSRSSVTPRIPPQEKTHHKSVKDLPIDRTETLPEVDRCTCDVLILSASGHGKRLFRGSSYDGITSGTGG